MSSRFFAFTDFLSSRSPLVTLMPTTHPNVLTVIDGNEDSESSTSGGSQIQAVPPLDHQHPRRGPGALETQVCILDTGAPSRGEGSSKGQVGRERGVESVGRMGTEESIGGQGGRANDIAEMIRYVGPNGWMFFPDSSGYSTEELFWMENFDIRLHTYSRVIPQSGLSGTVESLGEILHDINPWDAAYDPQRCFNCGATGHSFRSCPEPSNHALIALTQSYYQFFKQSGEGQPRRIHEVEEWKLQRLLWLEDFEPGEIRGPLLRDALGLLDENDLGENAPWLNGIMEWGYPKGWVGCNDPRELVRDRILSGMENVDYEDNEIIEEFIVHGEEGEERLQLACLPCSRSTRLTSQSETVEYLSAVDAGSHLSSSGTSLRSRSSSPTSSSSSSEEKEQRRWAQYKTTLFMFDRLPVYSGKTLPSMNGRSESTPQVPRRITELTSIAHCPRCTNVSEEPPNTGLSHPWRYPGAFDAFGPVGWREAYTKAKAKVDSRRESRHCSCDCHSIDPPEGYSDNPSSSVADLKISRVEEDLDKEADDDGDTDMELSD